MPALQELLDQQAALNRQITALRLIERAKAIAQIYAILDEHGLTVADVSSARPAARSGTPAEVKKVAPKYRDPVTGTTWTGRGLKPRWLSSELAAGKTLEEFAL
jgi:DNA-binding protein H-NS